MGPLLALSIVLLQSCDKPQQTEKENTLREKEKLHQQEELQARLQESARKQKILKHLRSIESAAEIKPAVNSFELVLMEHVLKIQDLIQEIPQEDKDNNYFTNKVNLIIDSYKDSLAVSKIDIKQDESIKLIATKLKKYNISKSSKDIFNRSFHGKIKDELKGFNLVYKKSEETLNGILNTVAKYGETSESVLEDQIKRNEMSIQDDLSLLRIHRATYAHGVGSRGKINEITNRVDIKKMENLNLESAIKVMRMRSEIKEKRDQYQSLHDLWEKSENCGDIIIGLTIPTNESTKKSKLIIEFVRDEIWMTASQKTKDINKSYSE